MHFSEMSLGKTNQTELIALLIVQGKTFVEGIENVFNRVKGSCSMLLLTEDGIIAARDKWGRTPIIIGKKDGAYAATSESSSLPNLDFEIDRYVGPGEILRLRADGIEQMRKPNEGMLWVRGNISASSIIPNLFLPSLVAAIVPVLLIERKLRGDVTHPFRLENKDNELIDALGNREKASILCMGLFCLLFVPVFKSVTHLPPFMPSCQAFRVSLFICGLFR